MAAWELFSKREKAREKAGQEDVFQYDDLPAPFRVQVIHIWDDALGVWHQSEYGLPRDAYPNSLWLAIFDFITEEKGLFVLVPQPCDPRTQCHEYILTAPTRDALDLIEITFRFVDAAVRELDNRERMHWKLINPDDAIAKLNQRFREHAIGYEFAGGEIVRVDSKFIHAAAVKPALHLLQDAGKEFAGALQEFLDAHVKHRKGENKEAIVSACKAFESTLKAICTARSWPFDQNRDTAKDLLNIVFANDLVPAYLQSHVGALRTVLEAGVPTVRNRTSGHGQGTIPVAVPDHYVAYVLHLTASNIVFLIESFKALP